jgi:hypothetical protein
MLMMPITLTKDEIYRITRRKRFSAQARQLSRMGIEHRLNAIGEPVVSRRAFEQAMGAGAAKRPDTPVLNLDFLEDAS